MDFDKVKEALTTPLDPVLSYLLQGVHTIGVEGTLSGSEGVGQFYLETVTLDGVTLPRFVVDLLIQRFVKSRYPSVAIDRPFSLPFSIEEVEVKTGEVELVGRSSDL